MNKWVKDWEKLLKDRCGEWLCFSGYVTYLGNNDEPTVGWAEYDDGIWFMHDTCDGRWIGDYEDEDIVAIWDEDLKIVECPDPYRE